MIQIVKRHKHLQPFDERKVYASVYAACLSACILGQEAESIANLVTREIKKWLEGKREVLASQVFRQVIDELENLNKEAAFMYQTHRDLS
ncbi:hypothetical protein A3H85_02505 [Candidatus Daviesbacteria bacterium RIFCSPLOWO2_02_FULL_40_8]|uniref:ATP-cone domain-containing protein n=1 Tax=Candidatus Daviesbacteria bacterium RIFCSPLOWO2_01_FULL_40_24 TaxID=1797787 RepID=A0A1F5MIF9_9BACT|nr:MAG: hypothetical protein A2780_03235 [Candidatus Daviesbacteria bacterium RIFCSPHIGHO2_01_FULL_41_45]OGE34161.1 MAG: hypothetical protein A3C32_00320 [Candidatus Daviesbacteria bacterium RIFCSPHIGHO2_02_FULL_41_14]OGE65145.1 MAG: hypothetical protein A3B49_01270 [Candidatus Daviesbacteria bacterium RIFCSPLOWO2_01_FULL_40_24]OGE66849.1 MAG: hypothetical protein A3H85_02505 [Candidatus Daviesbacteria bacterium RIFCSPLOWO2_02_FULL_40_8]